MTDPTTRTPAGNTSDASPLAKAEDAKPLGVSTGEEDQAENDLSSEQEIPARTPFYDLWFEAGASLLTVIRAGRIVHGRPVR